MSNQRAITGIRPTGDLSVANYLGGMRPIMNLQASYEGEVNIFVADLHALTDQEPELVSDTRMDTVRSFLAAGVRPELANIYLQSQIGAQTLMLTYFLSRHVSVAELMRVPTLKEKLRPGAREETATLALAEYPVLMAADIFIQDATDVPVGKDQLAHLELTRDIAQRFNKAYGREEPAIVVPSALIEDEGLKIAALDGDGKMSKSKPNGAIFLKDTPEEAERKIQKAKTAHPGEMSDTLGSHMLLCESLTLAEDPRIARMQEILRRHMDGAQVMSEFKKVMTDVVGSFLASFNERYDQISESDVENVLEAGGNTAADYADRMLARTMRAMRFTR